ncbi:Uncharacterised protein [Neisseria gonorrhoeae]|nr:Uncharacterised protein [Neisseria gonorrhoeae]CNO51068.1 Uncharacterised protein [Neisseria gonorrhoeae]
MVLSVKIRRFVIRRFVIRRFVIRRFKIRRFKIRRFVIQWFFPHFCLPRRLPFCRLRIAFFKQGDVDAVDVGLPLPPPLPPGGLDEIVILQPLDMLPYGGFGEARIFRQRFLRRITQALVVGAVAQLHQNKTLPPRDTRFESHPHQPRTHTSAPFLTIE